MTTDPIAPIRARWDGVQWRYEADYDGSYVSSARLMDATGEPLLDLDEPNPAELALLDTIGRAPGDVQALLTEIARLTDVLQPFATVAALALEGLPADAPADRHVSVGMTVRSLRAALETATHVRGTP